MSCKMRSDGEIFHEYLEKFGPFFRKVAWVMTDNHREKGDSWKSMSWAELMDNLSHQYDDMINDPDREDYYANIGAYAAMLWSQRSEQMQTSDETQEVS